MRRGLGLGAAAAAWLALLAPQQAAAQDCPALRRNCGAKISVFCLQSMGAGAEALSEDADCPGELTEYRSCLSTIVRDCAVDGAAAAQPAPLQSGACSPEDARQLFDILKDSDEPDDLETFAEACRGTPQALLAVNRANRLRVRVPQSEPLPEAGGLDVTERLKKALAGAGVPMQAALLPSNHVKLGDLVTFKVASGRRGRLTLIDINAEGVATVIFPNSFVADTLIEGGEEILVPSPDKAAAFAKTYGFDGFQAVPPTGDGTVVAVLAPPDSAVRRSPLFSKTRGFQPVAKPQSDFDDLAARIEQDLASGGDLSEWGFATIEYTIQ